MTYDFDRIIDRSGTASMKWSTYHGGSHAGPISPVGVDLAGNGPIPMWVADMDFPSPQPVLDALRNRIDHGIFGYTVTPDSYFDAAINWIKKRHGWEVSKEWITTTPGIVPALHFAIRAFCKAGDKVLLQQPAYYPFFRAIKNSQCEIVSSALIDGDDGYTMDFEDLERKASDPAVTMAILCSPHNPVGRVWREDELRQYGDICNRHGVLVVADEIHADLLMPGVKFFPYAQLGREYSDNVLVCTAPSKTFNLAGMHLSNMIIPNEKLRRTFNDYMIHTGVAGGLNPLALTAIEAAYNHGEEWLDQVLDYIWGNFQTLKSFVGQNMPQLKVSELQGTYLCWVDFRGLGLDQEKLEKLTQLDAKVLLDEGYIFGQEGRGFERFNLACPRPLLKLALERLKTEIERV